MEQRVVSDKSSCYKRRKRNGLDRNMDAGGLLPLVAGTSELKKGTVRRNQPRKINGGNGYFRQEDPVPRYSR